MRFAAFALSLASAGCTAEPMEEPRASAEPGIADGAWRITAIDGRPVDRRDVFIMIADREIVGGFDGCNAWGIEKIDGESGVMSDAMACPGDPLVAAMQTLEVVDQSAFDLSLRNAKSERPLLSIAAPEHSFLAEYAVDFSSTVN